MDKRKFVVGLVGRYRMPKALGGNDAVILMFQREAARLTVPTVEEEQKYGRIIQSAVRRILKIPSCSPGPKKLTLPKAEIIARMREREHDALDALVTRNLRMVLLIAKRFFHHNLRLDDLVAYGIEGLIVAALRFDPERKIKFCTFATYWVRHHMQRAMQNFGSTVRASVHEFERKRAINRARHTLAQKLGREPTLSEIARQLRISRKKIEKTLVYSVTMLSLDAPVSDDDHSQEEFIDRICYPEGHALSPEQQTELNIDSEKLRIAMEEVLEPREREVLNLRFGEDLTLRETAGHERVRALQKGNKAVSRERARQLQEQALSKLRHAFSDAEHNFREEELVYF